MELRIKPHIYSPLAAEFEVQQKVPFLYFFHRWKTVGVFDNYPDDLIFEKTFIPKDKI